MTAPQSVEVPTVLGRDPRGGGLYGQVVDALGQDIINGKLATGEIVHAEQLSRALGVSRSVVRESLRTLSSMGLVEARPQVGTRVLPRSRWDLLNPRIVYWRGRGSDYLVQQRELLELRLGVEATAARFAATRISAQGCEDLRAHAAAMRRCLTAHDRHGFYEADAEFHRVLLEGSGNAMLAQFADTIAAVLRARSIDSRPEMSEILGESVGRHADLADAVSGRDAARAERCAIEIVEETLHEFGAPAR